MESNNYTERAILLFDQHRYDLAATELRRQMAEDPTDSYPHSLIAICLQHLGKPEEALKEAQAGIHLEPDRAYAHYALAVVYSRQGKPYLAEPAILEAIRIFNHDPDFFELLAVVRYNQGAYPGALHAAEWGLAIDGSDVGCTIIRSETLSRLGRKDLGLAEAERALSLAPDNARAHANLANRLIEAHRADDAFSHYREALRIDPRSEEAREGVVMALRARHTAYRWMLTYYLWMGRQPQNRRFSILWAVWILNRILSYLWEKVPALAPVCILIRCFTYAFSYATWTANTLFNSVLRLDPVGRMALSRRQIIQSNYVLSAIGFALLSLLFYAVRHRTGYLGLCLGALILSAMAGSIKTSPETDDWKGEWWTIMAFTAVILVIAAVLGL